MAKHPAMVAFEAFGERVMGVRRGDESDADYLELLGEAMTSQRDDVRASLLASHDRDAVVRRKVADQVREVVANGACAAVQNAIYGAVKSADMALDATVTAASAVVLASDLRAPIPHGAGAWGPGDPMADVDAAMRTAERDEDGYYPTKGADVSSLVFREKTKSLGEALECIAAFRGRTAQTATTLEKADSLLRRYDVVGPAPEPDTTAELAAAHESAKAWVDRERLAEVERLLDGVMVGHSWRNPHAHVFGIEERESLADALSIVRSLLGGE